MHTILKSNTKEVIIGIDRPFVMIGEKINPSSQGGQMDCLMIIARPPAHLLATRDRI